MHFIAGVAAADRVARPRRDRGTDPTRRGLGPARQADAVTGGAAGPRARHPGADAGTAQLRRIRRRADRAGAGLSAPWWRTARCCGDALLAVPPHGWINLHFSLLPAWRGAAPVQAAIAAGDSVTGATTFRIERSLDTGPGLRRRHRNDPARRHRRRAAGAAVAVRAPRCWRRRWTASPTDRWRRCRNRRTASASRRRSPSTRRGCAGTCPPTSSSGGSGPSRRTRAPGRLIGELRVKLGPVTLNERRESAGARPECG